MKCSELFKTDNITLSFEVFPPKTTANFALVREATEKIAALKPDFMSITYGAGGSNSKATLEVAQNLERQGMPTLAHLTCVGETRATLSERLKALQAAGIENIMALRGDLPPTATELPRDFRYACELVSYIKSRGDFSVGGACYPEVHPESANQREDLLHLKQKVDSGCDFLTTQMFFDNNIFYNFLYKAREAGIYVPILPGIMPITRASQLGRAATLSGTNVPRRLYQLVDHFGQNPAAMQQAGIAYATAQIVDLLANGIRHIHVYSMNHPDVAEAIKHNIAELIK